MKTSIQSAVILVFSILAIQVSAGPWTAVASRAADSPEAVSVAIDFVRACNEKRYDDAKALMTPAHVRWHAGPGGAEAYLVRFSGADLSKLFQFRTVTIAEDRVRIDIKIHSKTRQNGENFRLNLVKVDGKWLLTHKN